MCVKALEGEVFRLPGMLVLRHEFSVAFGASDVDFQLGHLLRMLSKCADSAVASVKRLFGCALVFVI